MPGCPVLDQHRARPGSREPDAMFAPPAHYTQMEDADPIADIQAGGPDLTSRNAVSRARVSHVVAQ
jgi:hypothetical protein